MKKIYLDTCVLSTVTDENVDENILDAIDKLCDNDDVNLVTSKKTLEEFLKTKDKKKRIGLKLLYKIINKTPSANLITIGPATWGSSRWGTVRWGEGEENEDTLFTQLKKVFDTSDAEHVFQAVRSNCDYFLTTDNRLLRRAEKEEQIIKTIAPNIILANPIQMTKMF